VYARLDIIWTEWWLAGPS